MFNCNAALALGVAIGVVIATVAHLIHKRSEKKWAAIDVASKARREADTLKNALDTQDNVGRRIFNALEIYMKSYKDLDFYVGKIEDNGGSFYVYVARKDDGVMQGNQPIIQISADYVKGGNKPLHVHLGAYGADWWTGGEEAFINQVISFAEEVAANRAERLRETRATTRR